MADTTATATATINANSLNNRNNSLSFPGDITSQSYYTRMVFSKYNRSRPSSTRTDTTTATIVLPLPEQVEDGFDANWAGKALGIFGAEINEFLDSYNNLRNAGHGKLDGLMSGDPKAIGDLVKTMGIAAIAVLPASMQDGQIQGRIQQELGAVRNPHLSLLYEGQNLRTHTLSWTFSPRTADDAKTLGNIIKTIRQRVLPSYNATVSKFALDYPDTCEVQFQGYDADFKTKIFKSAVTNFRTNFDPAMRPEGRPAMVRMAMQLVETEIVTREDFQ